MFSFSYGIFPAVQISHIVTQKLQTSDFVVNIGFGLTIFSSWKEMVGKAKFSGALHLQGRSVFESKYFTGSSLRSERSKPPIFNVFPSSQTRIFRAAKSQ